MRAGSADGLSGGGAMGDAHPAIWPEACELRPLAASWPELNRATAWFVDPDRAPEDSAGPHIVVVDDFYRPEELAEVRARALSARFRRYCPPEPGQLAEPRAYSSHPPGSWYATSVVYFQGRPVARPFYGERFSPPWVRRRLAGVIGEDVDPASWDELGDGWNGAFHLIEADWTRDRGSIHHHYKPKDVTPRGWSGVVYLSPDAPPSAGTTIWRDRRTGLCVAGLGVHFAADLQNFELALAIENRFNRLVLFRENVLHRAEHGFGRGKSARLTQTFFFRSHRPR